MIKRIISFMTALSMTLTMVTSIPISVFAENSGNTQPSITLSVSEITVSDSGSAEISVTVSNFGSGVELAYTTTYGSAYSNFDVK